MIRTGHVGKVEMIALVTIFSATDIFLSYPQQLAARGGEAGWMIPLLSMMFAFIFFKICGRVINRYGLESLLILGQKELGWGIGGIVGSLYAIFLVLTTASEMRQFTETVVTTVLPKSPVGFVALPFLLVIFYFAYMGIEGLTRVAWFVGPWILLGTVLLLVFNLNWAQPEYLLPLWGYGLEQTVFQSIQFGSVFTNIFALSVLAPLLRKKEDFVTVGFWSILLVSLLYTGVMLMLLMVFPAETAEKMPFPMYQFARLIYLGRFFQRLESAFVFIWVACAVIKMATGLWLISYITATVWKMPVYRPLVIAFTLIIYSLSFMPKSFPETLHYDVTYLFNWGWIIVLVLPALVAVVVDIRRRKGDGTRENKTRPAS
ncbi:germination protein [Collibacillus ludicampi]|uniref:Germination protein n=1 Tax=Collibacillus ludicampi TaxID=2771369 RepID=A0AAV4LGK2_9BACL|nr:GerAB/ArcD/ProY family transporter [Collibacillus ludicampi]GIM46934.1 germination protein [Collibacillus ludicampi]